MDRQWVDEHNEIARKEQERRVEQLLDDIRYSPVLSPEQKEVLLDGFQRSYETRDMEYWQNAEYGITPDNVYCFTRWLRGEYSKEEVESEEEIGDFADMFEDDYYQFFLEHTGCGIDDSPYDKYLDSEWRFFDGDIIITDPCYIADWDTVGNPENGFDFYRGSVQGEWETHIIDDDRGKRIGSFMTDTATAGVFRLDDILAVSPEYNDHMNGSFAAFAIEDFRGNIRFVVEEEQHPKGEPSYNTRIVGVGESRATGEPIRFRTGFLL